MPDIDKTIRPPSQVLDSRKNDVCLRCRRLLLGSSPGEDPGLCYRCCNRENGSISVCFVEVGGKRNSSYSYHPPTTSESIAIEVKQRHGISHFEFDIYRTCWALSRDLCERLKEIWQAEMAGYRNEIGKRPIHGGFGPSYCRFDVVSSREAYWKRLLLVLLTSPGVLEIV